jgi:hypothetical protein
MEQREGMESKKVKGKGKNKQVEKKTKQRNKESFKDINRERQVY